MRILAVDPGQSECGCALAVDKYLIKAALIKGALHLKNTPAGWLAMARAVEEWAGRVDALVFERMPAYKTDWPKKTLSLHGLTGVTGVLLGLLDPDICVGYFPTDWEGSLKRGENPDKDPIIDRVKSRLLPTELENVRLPTARGKQHNVYDAVGILLKYVGRFEPEKYYPRE